MPRGYLERPRPSGLAEVFNAIVDKARDGAYVRLAPARVPRAKRPAPSRLVTALPPDAGDRAQGAAGLQVASAERAERVIRRDQAEQRWARIIWTVHGQALEDTVGVERGEDPQRIARLANRLGTDTVDRLWTDGMGPWMGGCRVLAVSAGTRGLLRPRRTRTAEAAADVAEPPDVLLDVSELQVDRISPEVEELRLMCPCKRSSPIWYGSRSAWTRRSIASSSRSRASRRRTSSRCGPGTYAPSSRRPSTPADSSSITVAAPPWWSRSAEQPLSCRVPIG
jgi:transposase